MPQRQEDTADIMVECECHKKSKIMSLWEKSGISLENRDMVFENYNIHNEMAKLMKLKAIEYFKNFETIKKERNNSLAFLGQPGAGKTHLTVAIATRFIDKGINVIYFQFRDAITKLKQNITNENVYQNMMDKYKKIPVLLIDDLFKKGKREEPVAGADIRAMFEIINYRYINHLPIIVSSELSSDDLIEIDEALGSRIIQMCKNYLVIVKGKDNNYRLKEVK